MSITYTGDYSGLELTELRRSIKRGEAFSAPREWAVKMLSEDPRQWDTEDESVAEEAALARAAMTPAMPAEDSPSMPDGDR